MQQSNSTDVQSLLAQGDEARRRLFLADAEAAYRQALPLAESAVPANGPFGTQHLPIGECLVKLGRLYESQNKSEASENCYRRALAIFANSVGDEYFDLAIGRDRVDVPQREAKVS